IEPNHPLFIDIDGQRVPFFVEDYDLVADDQAVVKFEFINSMGEAREICGCDVFLDQEAGISSDDPASDFHYMVGYMAFDHHLGPLGPITDYVPGDMNPVFLVEYKGKELIIPAADEIIHRINKEEQSIHFILPEGLTEL
ncbi:MAG: hypothetical protein KAT15_20550, partial [Bacteroidales bacterium]|nr:hypothetical protein [Bacteroidales bacterium]